MFQRRLRMPRSGGGIARRQRRSPPGQSAAWFRATLADDTPTSPDTIRAMRKYLFQVVAQTPFVPPNVDTLFLEAPGKPPIAYSISIPDDYSPAKPVPLVLALHFSADSEGAGRAILEMLVAQGLDKLGAILIAP